MAEGSVLQRTPLFESHLAHKAKMVDFGGWEMPVQYSGILQEHAAVRGAVGLFDVSHMGEIEISGPQAEALVNHLSTNDASRLQIGQAHYSALLYEHGGFVDDILVHKVSPTHFFLCVNASNQVKDYEHMLAHNSFDARIEFTSPRYAQIAVQGPLALRTVQKLTAASLLELNYYWFTDTTLAGIPARIARTGYTGEDGFEVYLDPAQAASTWSALLAAGEEFGIKPCGLGARNTLRLEAKMALYGHEITATTNPYEADLGWIVKLNKAQPFVGSAALHRAKETGITRKLVGFEVNDRSIARDGYEVSVEGSPAGWVTSGGPSPTLTKNIGLCYLPIEQAVPGKTIQITVRNAPVQATTVPTPFYKRVKA